MNSQPSKDSLPSAETPRSSKLHPCEERAKRNPRTRQASALILQTLREKFGPKEPTR